LHNARRPFVLCNPGRPVTDVHGTGEGADEGLRIVTPYEGSGPREWTGWGTGEPVPAPLRLHRTTVGRALTDYNGHMSESSFLLVFGDSADAFFRFLGIDEAYRAGGHSLFTVQTHLHHRAEAAAGDVLELSLRVLDADERRLHVYHEMADAEGRLLAAAEQLLVHVDTTAGRSCDLPPQLRERVEAVRSAHSALPVPDLVGRPLGIRRRQS
jgi:acyl-CoA thioesterase FadM